VRIIDFGYAHELNGRHTVIGSVPYMAPEITGDSFYNHKADIWSLGMITYEMFHQDIPFCSKKSFELDLFTQNVNKMKLDISPALSYESKDFITRMLALNPD
jgi:serine/threonine protein kinase